MRQEIVRLEKFVKLKILACLLGALVKVPYRACVGESIDSDHSVPEIFVMRKNSVG